MPIEKAENEHHPRSKDTLREVIRWASHAGAIIPLVILVVDYLTSNLTVNPIQAAEQRTGRIALVVLVLMLAVTPFQTIYRTRLLSGMKKRLGLYTFFYVCVHLFIFMVLDYNLNWRNIYVQIIQKTYILPGLIAFIILLALAITSFDWWKRKLARNWKHLHRLVYLAAILVPLHYALAQKGDLMLLRGNLAVPVVYGVISLLLLFLRLPFIKRFIHRLEHPAERKSSIK
jgi:methionine sulfoxide reductase heme-binding subunit